MDSMIEDWLSYFGVDAIGEITWSHATNSRDELVEALREAHFIESDIMMNSAGKIICSHPPRMESDLYLLELIVEASLVGLGLKLDFKIPEILLPSVEMLNEFHFKKPAILNADILQGNGGRPVRFNPAAFFIICAKHIKNNPSAIISPGWTTAENKPYTQENVDQMIRLCKGLKNVTFPVRLCLLEQSWPQLKRLLTRKTWTLSIWSGTDPVTEEQREWLKKNINPSRAFIDIG